MSSAAYWALAASALLIGASPAAKAAPVDGATAPIPVRVLLEGPAGCPTADEFVDQLGQELPVRAAGADEPAHTLLIRVTGGKAIHSGSLTSSSTAGVDAHDVEGKTCHEVVAALALTAALALEGRPVPPAQTARTSAPPVPLVKSQDAPLGEEEVAASGRASHVWSLAIGGRVLGGTLPFSLGPSLQLGLRPKEGVGWGLRVRATGTFPAARKSEVDWFLFELGADLCLEGWRWNRFEFGGCVSTDAGPLIAGGRNVEDASTAWLFLARSGLRLRARFDLTDEWSLSLDGGPDLVWSRPRARLDGPSLRNVLEAQFLGLSTGLFVERSF